MNSWPLGAGSPPDLARGIHGVLRLNGADDFRNGDAELRQLVGLHPQAHGVLARAEDLNVADARHARELIVEIDVGVVGQELGVVRAVRRIQGDQHQRRGHGLSEP